MVAVAALVGACTGAVVSTTAGWVIGPLVAVTMLPVVLRRGGDDEGEDAGAGPGPGQRRGQVPDDGEAEWAADRLDDVPRPGDWDGRHDDRP